MSRRSKITLFVILVLILLALLLALFWPRPGAVPPPVNDPQQPPVNVPAVLPGGNTSFNVNVAQPAPTVPEVPVEVDDRAGLKAVAKSFTELFGSFSSEGNYQNVVDAQYYMTDSVRAWADQYVEEQRAKPATGEFFGTTTRAIFDPEIAAYDQAAGTATLVVNARRIESGATIGSQNVYYQTLTLDFVKVSGAWKVNRFEWGQP